VANLVFTLAWLVLAIGAFRLVRALMHRLAVRAGFCRYPVLVGTSDLLRDGTARRLGFRTSRPGPLAA
jgi:hypothetical protein